MNKKTRVIPFCIMIFFLGIVQFSFMAFERTSSIIQTNYYVQENEGQEFKGLPNDLDKNKLIFIRLDSAIVEAERPKGRLKRTEWGIKRMHNQNVNRSNDELELTAQEYPFEHVITTRNQVAEYMKKGYKYVFDFKPFVDAQEGIRHSNGNYTVKFPVYILDLTTNATYNLGYLADNFVYRYKTILTRYLLRPVKSKYKSKLK